MTLSADSPRPARWSTWVTPAVGLAVAAVIVTTARWGVDWPAQEFRAWTARHGLTAWTNQWYDGVALPGYSVLYPLLSGVLGAPLTGLVAGAAAVSGATRFAPGSRYRAVGYHISVVLVLAADLIIGQVPYLVGVAFGVWAMLAVRGQRALVGGVLAAGASLASPLAGAFLLLLIPPVWSAYGLRRALPLGGAVAGIAVALIYGGAGGPFPFVWHVLLYVLGFAALVVLLAGDGARPVRVLGIAYAAAALVLFLVPNPVGGNLARMGQLLALPLLWHLLPRLRSRSRVLAGGLALLAAAWPAWPAASGIAQGAGDPSRLAGYYSGLLAFLRTQNPTTGRLEVVFTKDHWESYYVARRFPIARGWERQTDLAMNSVLYRHRPLSAATYRRWLEDNGVSLVALPSVPIDYGGEREAALLRHPPQYLRLVWQDANWRVWRVRESSGLVSGPASIRRLGTASVTLRFLRPGTATVRIRASGLWTIARGSGCVASGRHGWLSVTTRRTGRLVLKARVGLPQSANAPRCRDSRPS